MMVVNPNGVFTNPGLLNSMTNIGMEKTGIATVCRVNDLLRQSKKTRSSQPGITD